MLMAQLQPVAETTDTMPSYDDKVISQVHDSSKAHEQVSHVTRKTIIQTTDDVQIDSSIIFDDPCVDNNGGTSNHDSIAHEENHEIQMLAYNLLIQDETRLSEKAFKERENQYHEDIVDLEEKLSSHEQIVYTMAGLGYQNPERLKKAIAAQPKMYDGDMLYSEKLIINSTYPDETLEDAEEKISAEQTYFSIPSTSNHSSESKDVPSESPVLKMPNESRLLKMTNKLGDALTGFYTKINKTLLKDAERRLLSDSQNELREFYKTDVILTSRSLYKNLKDIKEELIAEVQEMLNIFESMKQKVNAKSPTEILLQKEVDRLLEVSLTSEIRDCVLLSAAQQKHDLLKDELEKSSNDFKEIQANLLNRIKILKNDFQRSQAQSIEFELKLQYRKEKMAYDVSWKSKLSTLNSKNVLLKDLLMTISELKSKLRTIEKGKNVNTKFDSSETLGKRSIPKSEQGVESSHSVRRSTSKDIKSKNSILKNTKSSSTYVWKTLNSACLDSNKNDTKTSNVFQINACISNSKTVKACVNVVKDGSNIVCISCGNDVFLNSHEKCVARHALSRKSSVKRALFTSPLAAKSKNLGATFVVTKSRLSVAKTPTATRKVSSALTPSSDSRTTRTLSSYMNNKIATSRKWQKWFEYQHGFNWTPKSKSAQSQSSVTKSKTSVRPKTKTLVSTQKWVVKLSTLPSAFVSCNAGDPACVVDFRFGIDHFAAITGYGDYVQGNLIICHVYYDEGLGNNLFLVGQFCDGDLEVAFHSNTCYVRNLEGDDLLTGSRDSNLYTIFIFEMATSSPVCLMSRATSTKSWLWHRRLSHLNFGTINQLTSNNLVNGLPKLKYTKDHLCSTCEQGKSKKASLSPKLVPRTESKLELLYMDLCRPIRVASINGKKYILIPNIKYFHVFGSLCYPTNDHDDLGKMKPKADIDIFIGYSQSSRGFRIYNRRTQKIMETINVKFDELIAMAFECNNLEPGMNCTNFNNSSEDSQSIPSKSDLDNLFGPLYEEYYEMSSQEVSDDSATNTTDNDHTSSSSSIVVDQDDAPSVVSLSDEQVSTAPNFLVMNEVANEFVQEDVTDFDGNMFHNAPQTPEFEVAESSSTYQDPSNMHQFHQQHRSTDRWTNNHPIE
ncbi:retrovirus-related pol polyprotein from transposon TNT 1-94 [Tanacetum coccineum]|uniref:Retrovirus-related pol polyprotein from transposon TNT 1-94 n=1 Tax=Tanacetum coccineum TaxID=301880 RepID=A0ABQ4Z7K1_9ASTR